MTDFQDAVLCAVELFCSPGRGYRASLIAEFVGRQPGRDTDRQHLGAVQSSLRALERAGLVCRMDDEPAAFWCLPAHLSPDLGRYSHQIQPEFGSAQIGWKR